MNLSEFLLARIAEDEVANDEMVRAEVASCRADGIPDMTEDEVRAYWADQAWWKRRLAECEAKRRIVEHCTSAMKASEAWRTSSSEHVATEAMATLRLLALPYADHPDYDEAWRP